MKQQIYQLCRRMRQSQLCLSRLFAIMLLMLPYWSLDSLADDYNYPENYFKLVSSGNVTVSQPYVDFDVMVVNYDGTDDCLNTSPIYIGNGSEEILVGYVDYYYDSYSYVRNLGDLYYYGWFQVIADRYKEGQDSDYKITKYRYYFGDKVLRMAGLKKTPLGYVQNNKYTLKMRIEQLWDFDHDAKEIVTKKAWFVLPDVVTEWGQQFSYTVKRIDRKKVQATVNAPNADRALSRRLIFHSEDCYVDPGSANYGFSKSFSALANTYYVDLPKEFDPSREYDIWSYCSTLSSEGVTIGRFSGANFNSPRFNFIIPDCWHASNLVATPDMWNKSVNLTWQAECSQPSLAETAGSWYIFKYAGDLNTRGATPKYVGKVPFKGVRDTYSFTDPCDSYDAPYVYIVSFGLNGWSDLEKTPVDELVRKVEVNNQRDWDMQLYTERRPSSIVLEWEHERVPEANASPFYVEHRTSQSAPWTILAEVNEPNLTKHSWQHRDLIDKEAVHYYRIRTHLLDTDFTVEDVNTTLGTNAIRSLEASKGTFAGEVHLSWECEMNNDREMNFEIFRRLSGSDAAWVQLGEMRGTAQTFTFVDDTPVPGNFYDYRVSSTYLEDDGHRTNPVFCSASGFSMSTGIISGKVAYGTGTAVAGVKMNLTVDSDDPTQTQLYSMRVRDIGGGLKVLRPTEELVSLYTNPFTAQLWVYITPNGGTPVTQCFIDAQHAFTLLAMPQNDGTYRLALEKADGGQLLSDIYLRSYLYYNVSVSFDNGKVTLHAIDSRDKQLKSCALETSYQMAASQFEDADEMISVIFGGKQQATSAGPYFTGYIDDVRLWRTALSDSLILASYDKVLSGQETGLAMYLPLDENISGQQTAYDYSMNANGTHNEWHADVLPGTKPDTNVPDGSLSLYTTTDEVGNYIIRGIPYTGEGTYYVVRPTMGLHEFSPSFVSRYISPNSLVHSGVNFKDVSSIPVSGQAFYRGTRYPVEGATLYVDGQALMIDGELAQTDVEGKFQISVPIGKHFIEIRKDGHTFENGGRYPADPNDEVTTFTFEKEVTGLRFTDETLVTIAGRVCGGPTESEKPLGFGDSKNNIGQAQITIDAGYPMNIEEVVEDGIIVPYPVADNIALTSPTDQVESKAYISGGKTADETRYIHVTTDRKTGEFAVKLPPCVYNVTAVSVPSNSEIQFTELPTIDATELDILTDSISFDSINAMYFRYAAALKQTYRTAPRLEVTDMSNRDKGAYGDLWAPYIQPLGQVDSVQVYQTNSDAISYLFGHPLLTMNKRYVYALRVTEDYLNHDNPSDVVRYQDPVQNAIIHINNEFSNNKAFYFKGSERGKMVDAQMSDTVHTDENGLASYMFRAGMPNVLDDHTLGLNLTYVVDEKTYEWNQNGKFRVIVLGNLTYGNDFITKGPDEVDFVLRDPPGSNSHATFRKKNIHSNQWTIKVTGGSTQDIRKGTKKHNFSTNLRIIENMVTVEAPVAGDNTQIISNHDLGIKGSKMEYTVSTDGVTRAMNKALGTVFKTLASTGGAFTLDQIKSTPEYEAEFKKNLLFEGESELDLENTWDTFNEEIMVHYNTSLYVEEVGGFFDILRSAIYSEDINTSDLPEFVGAPADLFFGSSENIIIGDVQSVMIEKNASGRYEIVVEDDKAVSNSIDSRFVYTADHVENGLIPQMETNRMELLTVVTPDQLTSMRAAGNNSDKIVYLTTLSPSDPRFGTQNTDQSVWGKLASDSASVSDGPSYTALWPSNPTEPLQDMVLFYNTNIDRWRNVLRDNERDKVEAIRQNTLIHNLSVSAGSVQTYSEMKSEGSSGGWVGNNDIYYLSTTEIERNVQGTAPMPASYKFVKSGISTRVNNMSGDSEEKGTAYTLYDTDPTDALSVDVLRSPKQYGPIFRTRGGVTSSPYEDQVVTKYYNKGTVISEATVPVDAPHLTFDKYSVSNVPNGLKAHFTMHLQNDGTTTYDRYFIIGVVDSTNVNGALITVDGKRGGGTFLVPAGKTLDLDMSFEQTNLEVLEYNDVAIYMRAQSQADETSKYGVLESVVPISVTYTPSSSPIQLVVSTQTINCNSDTTLVLTLKGFNRHYRGLQGIRLLSRYSDQPNWNVLKEWTCDSTNTELEYLPVDKAELTYKLSMRNTIDFPDGYYYFRAETYCQYGDAPVSAFSDELAVAKDVAKPKILGLPEPADGILDIGEMLSLRFNENIREVSDPEYSIIVKGVKNGVSYEQGTALQMSGADQTASTEASINFNSQPFAGEMWLRLRSAGTILRHGQGNRHFAISVDEGGHLVVDVNGSEFVSQNRLPLDGTKTFLSYSYNYNPYQSTLSAQAAADDATIPLFEGQLVPQYSAEGRLAIGLGLNGTIQNMTLWDVARTPDEALRERNRTHSATSRGLIGYWKMDEGHGNVVRDIVRSRHLIAPDALWYLHNKNEAAHFDGTSKLTFRSPGTLYEDETANYAVEFWFRGEKGQQVNTNLLEAGSQNSKDSLVIVHNANGRLQLIAGGRTTTVGTTDYFDGQWHHLALNVLRFGTTSISIDGERIAETSSANVPTLVGKFVTMGNKFHGDIDELRYWRATMSQQLLASRIYERVDTAQAKQEGLAVYLPFEASSYDDYNQLVTEFSLDNHSGHKIDLTAENVLAAVSAPSLKEAPANSAWRFKMTKNEREIYLELTDALKDINGQQVTVTVREVYDEHDNYCDPISWTTLVNQNPLVWEDKSLEYSSTRREGDMKASFRNLSGTQHPWFITHLPAWLIPDRSQGTIDPGAGPQTINFTLSPSLPIGHYTDVIYLVSEEGIYEPLSLDVTIEGERPNWWPYTYTSDVMNMIGQMKVDGRILEENSLLGAFTGDKCVGAASPIYNKNHDTWFVMLSIYCNDADKGKPLQFKIWDGSTGITYPMVLTEQAYTIQKNMLFGSFADPVIWEASHEAEQTLHIFGGWNWSSLYVIPSDPQLTNLFVSPQEGNRILSSDGYASFTDGQWQGNLQTLGVGQLYKIYSPNSMYDECEIPLIGSIINPQEHAITITNGWNWIGVNTTNVISCEDAFAGLDPEEGDMVKGLEGFNTYVNNRWRGLLTTLTPGNGYLYFSKSTASKTFCYPSVSSYTSMRSKQQSTEHHASAFGVVNARKYPNSMTMIAEVHKDGALISNGEVAVFVDGECRFITSDADEELLRYLNVPGQGGGRVEVFVALDGLIYTTDVSETYVDNKMVGTVTTPLIIRLGQPTSLEAIGSDRSNDEGYVYDVLGRRIDNQSKNGQLPKGIYIQNGKKVVK
ncbi:MAG: hypothetical protein J5543_05095 [Bacteroidales bacterium]|nr:hypothetical protein [Bacteroidales bacterium]